MRESTLTKRIRLQATKLGCRLFRNNVGVAVYPDGSRVRYGLCKGSSDLIGWTPVVITQEHIGRTIAVFTAVETKGHDTAIEDNQENFANKVTDAGGLAIITRAENDYTRLVREARQGKAIRELSHGAVSGAR